ncbi:MAG TPA: glycosyltransferase, partial [Candidatus Methylomirabilis sp.]|nr:glycosyltransferase [Candidatus Methylomirabilis sp.]
MRVLYLTIDNINDPVILAQTFPFLGRLAALPGVDGIDLFALRKDGGERYRAYLPAGVFRVRIGKNHGIWHPLSLLTLLRFALRAWSLSRAGTLLIGRNPVSLLCLFPAALRRGTRLVLDYRGLLSEEYVLQGKITRRGWWHRLLRGLEAWALQRADVILCVSDRLRRRSIRWRPTIAERLRVVPCCYDPRMVRRDETAIERLRVELNAAADFLLAYAGSLSAWNRPEAILAVFRAFRAIRPDARLLLLTHDLAKAQVIFGA